MIKYKHNFENLHKNLHIFIQNNFQILESSLKGEEDPIVSVSQLVSIVNFFLIYF